MSLLLLGEIHAWRRRPVQRGAPWEHMPLVTNWGCSQLTACSWLNAPPPVPARRACKAGLCALAAAAESGGKDGGRGKDGGKGAAALLRDCLQADMSTLVKPESRNSTAWTAYMAAGALHNFQGAYDETQQPIAIVYPDSAEGAGHRAAMCDMHAHVAARTLGVPSSALAGWRLCLHQLWSHAATGFRAGTRGAPTAGGRPARPLTRPARHPNTHSSRRGPGGRRVRQRGRRALRRPLRRALI